jgi:hypothetical protein
MMQTNYHIGDDRTVNGFQITTHKLLINTNEDFIV